MNTIPAANSGDLNTFVYSQPCFRCSLTNFQLSVHLEVASMSGQFLAHETSMRSA